MNTARILLVDDDYGMLELLSMRLAAEGYQTICVGSGTEALARMEDEVPDIVLTDLRMDKMGGLDLFQTVHENWPSIPVIVMTAHGSIPEAVEATQRGVYSFLTKPIDKHKLLDTLDSAAKSGPTKTEGTRSRVKTRSAKVFSVLEHVRVLAEGDINVLITGESGTGKELIAQELHDRSARVRQPFVTVNCSAIPTDMLESELFGHVKGAFTGATRDHEGLFASADKGVLFLDEIGDMPLALQAKLLRVLQDRTIRPVGATRSVPIDVRVVSATHKDLPIAIRESEFREDLFYRLNVVNIHLPSLRERREDILLLARHFLGLIAERCQAPVKQLSPKAITSLLEYDWPGNVRQLENVMEQCAALSRARVISDTLINNAIPGSLSGNIRPLSEAKLQFEREYVASLLKSTDGNVSLAAHLAGRNRSDFYRIVSRHDINASDYKYKR